MRFAVSGIGAHGGRFHGPRALVSGRTGKIEAKVRASVRHNCPHLCDTAIRGMCRVNATGRVVDDRRLQLFVSAPTATRVGRGGLGRRPTRLPERSALPGGSAGGIRGVPRRP